MVTCGGEVLGQPWAGWRTWSLPPGTGRPASGCASDSGRGCTRVSQNSPELPEPAETGGEVCVPGPLQPGPGPVAQCWSIIPAPKGCGSDSQSGPIPRLWVRSLVKVTNQCWFFFSLLLAPFLTLNITSLGED